MLCEPRLLPGEKQQQRSIDKFRKDKCLHLGNEGHAGAQLLEPQAGHIDAVDGDCPGVQLHKPEQRVDQAALARACFEWAEAFIVIRGLHLASRNAGAPTEGGDMAAGRGLDSLEVCQCSVFNT